MTQIRKVLSLSIFFGIFAAYADEKAFSPFNKQTSDQFSDYDDDFDYEDREKGVIAWVKKHYIVSAAVVAAGVAGVVAYNDKTILNQVVQNMSDFRDTLFPRKEEIANQSVIHNGNIQQQNQINSPEHVSNNGVQSNQHNQSIEEKPLLFSPNTIKEIQKLIDLPSDVVKFLKDRIGSNKKRIHDAAGRHEENISDAFIQQVRDVYTVSASDFEANYLSLVDPREKQGQCKYYWRIGALFKEAMEVLDIAEQGKISKRGALQEVDILNEELAKIEKILSQQAQSNTTNQVNNKTIGGIVVGAASVGAIIGLIIVNKTNHWK